LESKYALEMRQYGVDAPASNIEGEAWTIVLTVPPPYVAKPIDGLRYLLRETLCLFKQGSIYSTLYSNLPLRPYIKFF
jgi:hypothetical protein